MGPGWTVAFADDYPELGLYILQQLNLNDKRKFWAGGYQRYYPSPPILGKINLFKTDL